MKFGERGGVMQVFECKAWPEQNFWLLFCHLLQEADINATYALAYKEEHY